MAKKKAGKGRRKEQIPDQEEVLFLLYLPPELDFAYEKQLAAVQKYIFETLAVPAHMMVDRWDGYAEVLDAQQRATYGVGLN